MDYILLTLGTLAIIAGVIFIIDGEAYRMIINRKLRKKAKMEIFDSNSIFFKIRQEWRYQVNSIKHK